MKNFKVVFGCIWSAATIIIGISIIVGLEGYAGEKEIAFVICYLAIFLAIGLFVTFLGVRKYIMDVKTEKFGELCYGLVQRVKISGKDSEDGKYIKARVKVYIQSYDVVDEAEEEVLCEKSTDENDYAEGDFVRVKYYNGDINFVSKIASPFDIPEEVRERLEDGLGESEDGEYELPEVDTENWTLTEEAFSTAQQFEENRTGEFLKRGTSTEEEYPYRHNDAWNKQIKMYGVFAVVIWMLIVALAIITTM